MCDLPNSLRYCPKCNRATAVKLDKASGHTVCTECALIMGGRYRDESTEWRAFALDGDDGASDRSRVGAAADRPLAHGHLEQSKASADVLPRMCGAAPDNFLQLGITITDSSLSNASVDVAENVPAMPRKRGAAGAGSARKMRGAVGPTLPDGLRAVGDMADRLGLAAAVSDHAKELFEKLHGAKGLPRGSGGNLAALYAACIHIACRAKGTPRTYKELASVTGDKDKAVVRTIGQLATHIKKRLGLAEEGGAGQAAEMHAVVRAGDYVRRFGAQLGMGSEEVSAAEEAARRLERDLDVRRNPESIAATVVYMASINSGANKSYRDVARATRVSEATIKDVYRDLSHHAELLFGSGC